MDSVKFKDKLVFITGASSGIGRATAYAYASLGASLILTGRRFEKLEEVKRDLEEKYQTSVEIFSLDVRSLREVEDLFLKLGPNFLDIDILINNAGLASGLSNVAEANISDWEQMIDTNIKGLLFLTRKILPRMIERKSGYVVNIASTAGHVCYAGGSVYCATKHAVKAISKTLNLELMGSGVRVTSIDPGMVQTEFSLVRFKGDQKAADDVYKGVTPLTAEDIADSIIYVTSRPRHVLVSEMVLLSSDQGDGRTVQRKF